MTAMRFLFALAVGLSAAAVAGTAAFLLLNGDLDIVTVPWLLWSLPFIGAIATAPGWVIAMLAFVPVVTHRIARKPVSMGTYYLVAMTAGGVSPFASPLGILAISSDELGMILPVLLACGSVAGLSFAAIWHFFVLNGIAERRDDRTGIIHG